MNSLMRFGIAVSVCLSGWALAPFVDLPKEAFSWERYADVYSLIHRSVIPAAAVTTGSAGSFFQTDVDINNTGSGGEALYELWWLPRGGDNSTPVRSPVFSLLGRHSVRIDDVLTQVFGLQPNQVGAVVIASDSDRLVAMSRTYTVSAGGAPGTFGQALPAVPADEMIQAGDRRRIIFFTESTAMRGNLGCVNGTDSEVEIAAVLYDVDGRRLGSTTVTLGPWGNEQLNRVFRGHEPVNGYVEVRSDTAGASYYCYGSVLDNGTSDPTTILPQRPTLGTTYFVPAAALASGAENAFFETALEINNVGQSTSYVLRWLPRGEDNTDSMQSAALNLGPGASTRFENVLADVFNLGSDSLGALAIQSPSDSLVAMSRTANVAGGAGTFGQSLAGIQEGDMIRAGERRRIIFLSEGANLRSNVGCVNATDEDIDINLDVYDESGVLRSRREMELEPWSNDQINRILLPLAPGNGYVEVSSGTTGALFYCYGSVLDNGTSDPTTIPPL